MSAVCDECGKSHHFTPEQLDIISPKRGMFSCEVCGHAMAVSKKDIEKASIPLPSELYEYRSPLLTAVQSSKTAVHSDLHPEFAITASTFAMKLNRKYERISNKFGLKSRMMTVFGILPILLMLASGLIYQSQINDLTTDLTNIRLTIFIRPAQKQMADNVNTAALQLKNYLLNHQPLNRIGIPVEKIFKQVAAQTIGITGYAILLENSGQNNGWRIISAAGTGVTEDETANSPNLISSHMVKQLSDALSHKKALNDGAGLHTFIDTDGRIREILLAVSAVEETQYIIAGIIDKNVITAAANDFVKPILNKTAALRKITFAILGVGVMIIGLTAWIYGFRVAQRIKNLADAADRISIGELNTEIKPASEDEIGKLAIAICRMQASLLFAAKRLRRRQQDHSMVNRMFTKSDDHASKPIDCR